MLNLYCRFAAVLMSAPVVLALSASPAPAARPDGPPPASREDAVKASDPLVRRIQEALVAVKRYFGSVDGRFNAELDKAVRAYQKESGLKVDGLLTEALADHLETGVKVSALLSRLASARSANIEAAKRALLSRPATRRLLEGGDELIADPTRDPEPCFRDPTPSCLLAEAAESAKAVSKPEMRDWALGEVLAAQAKAGLTEEAMDSARRIRDPRLIMVALRDIAKAQAAVGRSDDALAAAEIIPDALHRLEALETIASAQAEQGKDSGLKATVERYLSALKDIDDAGKQVAFRSRLAEIMSRSGDNAAATAYATEAEASARAIAEPSQRGAALRRVVSAVAEIGNPQRALALLKEVDDKADHTPVLVSAAAARVRAGDADEALAIAAAIEAERYRAVMLIRIAVAQAEAGDEAAARNTMDKALVATEEIKLPFARDYAFSRMALALIAIGGNEYAAAAQKAGNIDDAKLRATVLWTIAGKQRRAGFGEGAALTEKSADEATKAIKSSLSRVWMFSDIAAGRAEAGEGASARSAFDRAIAEAKDIKNAWGRARALAKVASTLIELPGDNVEKPPSE